MNNIINSDKKRLKKSKKYQENNILFIAKKEKIPLIINAFIDHILDNLSKEINLSELEKLSKISKSVRQDLDSYLSDLSDNEKDDEDCEVIIQTLDLKKIQEKIDKKKKSQENIDK